MLFLRSLVVAATAVVGVLATPSMLAPRQALVGNQEGTHDGYYYNYWTDGTADVEFHLGPAGAYNATWSGEGDWIGGKGWQPGSFTRIFRYAAIFEATGDARILFHGWTTNPTAEYFIIENYTGANPATNLQRMGRITQDGATYNIYQSYPEVGIHPKYWAIRASKRTNGIINLAAFRSGWLSAGMTLGTSTYQILAVQSLSGDGTAAVAVNVPDRPPLTTTLSAPATTSTA